MRLYHSSLRRLVITAVAACGLAVGVAAPASAASASTARLDTQGRQARRHVPAPGPPRHHADADRQGQHERPAHLLPRPRRGRHVRQGLARHGRHLRRARRPAGARVQPGHEPDGLQRLARLRHEVQPLRAHEALAGRAAPHPRRRHDHPRRRPADHVDGEPRQPDRHERPRARVDRAVAGRRRRLQPRRATSSPRAAATPATSATRARSCTSSGMPTTPRRSSASPRSSARCSSASAA